MAQRYLFFNSRDGDRRRYQAQDFAEYFGSVLSSGLLHTNEIPGMSVSVEAGTMNTVVTAGKAIMRGHLYENTTPVTLTHRIPEPTMDRIDRIVLRLDLRQSERNILLHVKEGEPSTSPTPPPLQRDNTIYEISLAQIFVERNTSTLRQVDLTDERLDEDLCGLVYSLISIPTDQLQAWITAKIGELDGEAEDFIQYILDMEQQFQSKLEDFEQEWDDWFANQQTEGFVMANEKGQPNGIPILGADAKVPYEQLPNLEFIPITEKGEPEGVATLDNEGRVLYRQLGYYSPSDEMLEVADIEGVPTSADFVERYIFKPYEFGKYRIKFSVYLSPRWYRHIKFWVRIKSSRNDDIISPEYYLDNESSPLNDPVTGNFTFDTPYLILPNESLIIETKVRDTKNNGDSASFNRDRRFTSLTLRGSIE